MRYELVSRKFIWLDFTDAVRHVSHQVTQRISSEGECLVKVEYISVSDSEGYTNLRTDKRACRIVHGG